MHEGQTKKQISLRDVFNVLDTDGDGSLTREEVLIGAQQLGLTNMQAMQLFDALDTNRSGFLTLEETIPKPKLTLENLAYVMMEQRMTAQAEVAGLRAQVAKLEALSVESSNPEDAAKAARLAAEDDGGGAEIAFPNPRAKPTPSTPVEPGVEPAAGRSWSMSSVKAPRKVWNPLQENAEGSAKGKPQNPLAATL